MTPYKANLHADLTQKAPDIYSPYSENLVIPPPSPFASKSTVTTAPASYTDVLAYRNGQRQLEITIPSSTFVSPSESPTEKAWYDITKYIPEKKWEGVKQVFSGTLDAAVGVVEISGGIAVAGGGTALSDGALAPLVIPVGSGMIALGGNNVVSGGTKAISGFKNIFGSSDQIHHDEFNPISKAIDATTKPGSTANTVLHATHFGADFFASGGTAVLGFLKKAKNVESIITSAKTISTNSKTLILGLKDLAAGALKNIVSETDDANLLANTVNKVKTLESLKTIATETKNILIYTADDVKNVAVGLVDDVKNFGNAVVKKVKSVADSVESTVAKIKNFATAKTEDLALDLKWAFNPEARRAKDMVEDLHKTTELRTPLQGVNTLDEIEGIARANKPRFDSELKDLAATTNGKAELTDLKTATTEGAARVESKILGDYHGNPKEAADLLRGSIVYEKLSDAYKGAQRIIKEFDENGYEVVKVKNKFLHEADSGYRDINIVVKNKQNGGLAEIQAHVKEMFQAKKEEEKIYTIVREMENRLKALESKPLAEQNEIVVDTLKKTISEFKKTSRALFQQAWENVQK